MQTICAEPVTHLLAKCTAHNLLTGQSGTICCFCCSCRTATTVPPSVLCSRATQSVVPLLASQHRSPCRSLSASTSTMAKPLPSSTLDLVVLVEVGTQRRSMHAMHVTCSCLHKPPKRVYFPACCWTVLRHPMQCRQAAYCHLKFMPLSTTVACACVLLGSQPGIKLCCGSACATAGSQGPLCSKLTGCVGCCRLHRQCQRYCAPGPEHHSGR